MADSRKAKVTLVASFPPQYFLENIVVRHDGSILVTVFNQKRLYYLPYRPGVSGVVTPQLLHEFEQFTTGILELQHDVFYISTTAAFEGTSPSKLWRLDMRSFTCTTDPVPSPVPLLTFPPESRALNGSCVLSPSVILCADSWADLIWRVDIPEGKGTALSARVWLNHSMLAHCANDPTKQDVPGINGIKYNPSDGHVYFTTTAQTIFGRIAVDPDTLDPAGEPVDVTERWMWGDDLVIDDEAGVAYVATHRQNTIERISLHSGVRENVAGEPLVLDLIGPTAGAWGRNPGNKGRLAYFTADGGIKNPHNGVVREAKVLRVEFPPIAVVP